MAHVESIESCCAPLSQGQWSDAQKRITRRLAAKPLSAHEAASAIDAACQAFAYINNAKSVTFASLVAASGALDGARLDALSPDPLLGVLKLKVSHQQSPAAASEWGKIALRLATHGAPVTDARRNRKLFLLFLGFSPTALAKAVACGAVSPLPPAQIEAMARSSLTGMNEGKAPAVLESLLSAGFPAPAHSPGEALLLLSQACSNGAGRHSAQALIEQAGAVLDSPVLTRLVAASVGGRDPDARSLGSLLKAAQWESEARSEAAFAACKAAVEARPPRATPFMTAASHCDWSPLASKATQAFGAPFLAQLERQALDRSAPKPAPAATADSRPRLSL